MAQHIFINCNGYTLDRENTPFQAVAERDGRIVKVGCNEEALQLKDAGTEVVDLGGKTVLPGFNDSHMHLLSYGYSLEMVDLNDCTGIDEMKRRIHAYIEENEIKKGAWVEGRGWDQNLFTEGRMPAAADFDDEFPDYYIVLGRTCAQVSVVTTNVLKLAGIYESPKQAEGGYIHIDGDNRATGLLDGLATEIVYNIIPKLGTERIKKAVLAACDSYVSAGITSVQTDDFELLRAGTFKDILDAYFEMDKAGVLPLRVNMMCHLPTREEMDEFFRMGMYTGFGSPWFKVGPYKMIVDGSLGARLAALRAPYADNPPEAPDNTGVMYTSYDEMVDLIGHALDNKMQIVCDSIGDRAMRATLDVYIHFINQGYRDRRFCIDHCQISTEGIIDDFGKYGIIGGLEIIFLSSDIEILEQRVGKRRAAQSYNWRRYLDAGAVIAAGSDSPVEEYSVMAGIHSAVNRTGHDGSPAEGYEPDQKLTVDQAIRAFTAGCAYATFEEDVKGSIEPGKYCDLVVLDEDPYTADLKTLKNIPVLRTVVNGKTVYEK